MPVAFIFDVDGTLIDSVDAHAEAWRRAFEHFGKQIPFERVRSQIGKGGDQLMPVFLSRDELARFGKELEAYRAELFKKEFRSSLRPFPDVRELFQSLRERGSRIALASSGSSEDVEFNQRLANIDDLVEKVTTKSDAKRSKPHPDIFEAALELLGDSAGNVIVVGDTPYDAEAAQRAGIENVIGVLCGGFAEGGLRGAGCKLIYQDPAAFKKATVTSYPFFDTPHASGVVISS